MFSLFDDTEKPHRKIAHKMYLQIARIPMMYVRHTKVDFVQAYVALNVRACVWCRTRNYYNIFIYFIFWHVSYIGRITTTHEMRNETKNS